jgi:LysM repeat protein
MSAISNNPASSASASLVVDANRNQVASTPPTKATGAPTAVNHSLTQGESVQLETYQVKKGDTLWDIADLKLGDPMKWKQIHALNKEQIKNPDLIYPGQTLTLPKEIQVAPTPPPANIPSPVDTTPPPAAPTPPPVAEEPTPAPVAAEPKPAKPLPPVAEPPVAAEPPAPTKPSAPLLRPPGELPFPAPKLPNVADPKPAPVATEPAPTQPTPAEPTAPVDTPAAPAPVQTTPTSPPLSSIGEPTAKSTSGVGKAAIIGGVVGTVGTGATLIAMTRTAGNLGGYQTAQVVAKGINGVIGKVGLSVPSGPALSHIIKKVGGPKVAGSVTAVTVGLAAAGVAAGGYFIYQKATSKEGTVASLQQPEPAAKPANTPAPPANVNADSAFGNVQPVVDGNAAPPAADLSPLQDQLDTLLNDKKYMLFGAPNQPEEIRGTAVQIWEQGSVSDKVALAQTLVGKGQSEVLGRILTHQSIDPMVTTQVMSTPGFPVEKFMNDLSDNHAFVVLDKLATVATTGEPSSAKLLSEIATSYDGTFSDREKPFTQLRQQYQSTGVWAQLPASVTQQIDKLLR